MNEQELNEARDKSKRIRELERHLEALRLSVENIVPVLDGMPHAKEAKSKVERIALQIIDSEHKIEVLRGELECIKTHLANVIMTKVDNPSHQTLLFLRYVSCLSFKEISRRMRCSLRHVFRLHEQFFKCHLAAQMVQ